MNSFVILLTHISRYGDHCDHIHMGNPTLGLLKSGSNSSKNHEIHEAAAKAAREEASRVKALASSCLRNTPEWDGLVLDDSRLSGSRP